MSTKPAASAAAAGKDKAASDKKKGPSPLARAYLVAYNVASALGWALVVAKVAQAALAGHSAAQLAASALPIVKIVQTTAALEIAHSILRLVPSPWFTTFVQVMSRLIVLWGYTVPASSSHWSLYLLLGSWSLVEVPRYLFYVWQLVFPSTPAPGPLFWLRYSLFAVLYPTGISGEILQLLAAQPWLKQHYPALRILSYVVLFGLYPPGSPFMYFHMVKTRKQQFKKRAEAGKPAAVVAKPEGLLFPIDAATGEVSTTNTGRAVFAAASKVLSPALATAISTEKSWRFKYGKHVVSHVKAFTTAPAKTAVAAAQAGLDECYSTFRFVRSSAGFDGTLAEALTTFKGTFAQAEVKGTKPTPAGGHVFELPYQGAVLTGAALKAQVAKWAAYGTIEPSCRDAIIWAADNATDLTGRHFVLLGAGAAMGPLQVLLSLGATVIAIDIDRPAVWTRILTLAQASPGKVIFPVKSAPASQSIADLAAVAGGNLFTETPEIANFVAAVAPGEHLTIGGYAYLDAAAHVQVSLAMDAVMRVAIERRGAANVSLGFLCSPTDVFAVPQETLAATKANRAAAPLWQKLLGGLLKPNGIPVTTEAGDKLGVLDGIVVAQGPNYALAKRIQHWRAVTAFAAGAVASTNIAPSTSTASVVSNASFAAAYGGMSLFKPMEVMRPETSNAVMAALLLHDVINKESAKNPKAKAAAPVQACPALLFAPGAFHGGVWRMGSTMDSIGPIAAAAYYAKQYQPALLAVLGAVGYVAVKGLPFALP